MSPPQLLNAIDVLLVDDDPGDTLMIREAFEHNKVRNELACVADGVEAMRYLRREGEYASAPRPGPDPARPQPAAQGRARSAGRDQGRPAAARRSRSSS